MGVIKLNLFADIDVQATADNVDNFLKNKLPRLILRSGRSLTDLSSPKLSLASAHSNGVNRQEDLIVNGLEIEKAVKAVHETIFHCREISKTVLIGTYLKNYTPNQVVMAIPYEQAYFFKKIKPIALNEFADCYDYWQRKCNVAEEDIVDLHVIKAAPVNIFYVDENNNPIMMPKHIYGDVGDYYDTNIKYRRDKIAGVYVLDKNKLPSNVWGTLSNQEQNIIYVYQKNKK